MILRSDRSNSSGGVLVEFALVSFALYLILAAVLDLGRVMMAGQLLQSAADQLARELAVAPLPATLSFEEALRDPYVVQRIYDPAKLVVPLSVGGNNELEWATYPIVNQMLRPLMIVDLVDDVPVLRYPGAVVRMSDDGGNSFDTVLIPRILATAGSGVEVIEWVPVVEEILPSAIAQSHFPISAPLAAFRGNAMVRLNYPFQAATMSAFDPTGTAGPFGDVIEAPETVTGPDEGTLVETNWSTSHRGPGGLGYHFAFANEDGSPKKVLPYRKLISVRSFHRRENYGG